jgi:adenylosuccinate lyase
VATQVIPRDRHCEVLFALSMIMTGLERLCIELRHLQRSEVSEVEENFSRGQKGSSAMPHKKNPISAENVTGLSRLVRGYFHASQENIALWHERDISHSSVERVAFPDAFILTDYAVNRVAHLMSDLLVKKEQMKNNLESSQGQIFSSLLLLEMVQKGLSREEAYSHIQRLCHGLRPGEHLREVIQTDKFVSKFFNLRTLEDIFEGRRSCKSINKIISKALNTSTFSGQPKTTQRSPSLKAKRGF